MRETERMLFSKLSLPVMGVVILSMAGCQTDEAHVGSTNQSILGGVAITEGQFPTVVALIIAGGSKGLCTGTLVAPNWVLTAAHCVSPTVLGYSSQQEVTQNSVIVIDGTDLRSSGTALQVAETASFQGFERPGDKDVGLVRLSKPLTDRTPTPINYDSRVSPPGILVDMVGYGRYDINNPSLAAQGFFLSQEPTISCSAQIGSNALFLCFDQKDGSGKCNGDSGGPSFAVIDGVQKVVGITSFGDSDCKLFGADMRTDASADFIRDTAPELFCIADGYCQETCGSGTLPIDPDCMNDCSTDNDCTGTGKICDLKTEQCYVGPEGDGGLGAACGGALDPKCLSGLCAQLDGESFCSQTCTLEPDSCPTGFECLATGDAGNGACFQPSDGGCSVGNSRSSKAGGLILFIALMFIRRRKRSGFSQA